MKAANQQQKRRPAGRKPAPSTRRRGKPRADQVQKGPAPPVYQISVRGQLPTDLVDRVSLLHATALLDLHPQVAQGKGAQLEQGEVKLSAKPVTRRSRWVGPAAFAFYGYVEFPGEPGKLKA